MNVNVDTFIIYSPSDRLTGIVYRHYVRPVNKPSKHAQELCISRDVNKMHMAEGAYPRAKRPVEKFLFLRQNDEDLS